MKHNSEILRICWFLLDQASGHRSLEAIGVADIHHQQRTVVPSSICHTSTVGKELNWSERPSLEDYDTGIAMDQNCVPNQPTRDNSSQSPWLQAQQSMVTLGLQTNAQVSFNPPVRHLRHSPNDHWKNDVASCWGPKLLASIRICPKMGQTSRNLALTAKMIRKMMINDAIQVLFLHMFGPKKSAGPLGASTKVSSMLAPRPKGSSSSIPGPELDRWSSASLQRPPISSGTWYPQQKG